MKSVFMKVIGCRYEDVVVVLKKVDNKHASVEIFCPSEEKHKTSFYQDGAFYHCQATFEDIFAAAKHYINYHNILDDKENLEKFIHEFLKENF